LPVLVWDEGTIRKAAEYLEWAAKILLSPLALGCAETREREPFLSVAGYTERFGLEAQGYAEILAVDAVNQLREQTEDLRRRYRQYPNFSVPKPFKFTYGDAGTLGAKLENFGKASITFLFIFAHGRTDESPDKRKPDIVYVAGIPDFLIVETCMPYMKPPAYVRLTGCLQRSARWEQLSRDGVTFGCPAAFEGRICDARNGLIDMHNMHCVTIDGEKVGPEWKERKTPSLESLEGY
jgi:hypothetical protein